MRILNPWQSFWFCIWNISEYLHIPLGNMAPRVFGCMIGAKRKCVKRIK